MIYDVCEIDNVVSVILNGGAGFLEDFSEENLSSHFLSALCLSRFGRVHPSIVDCMQCNSIHSGAILNTVADVERYVDFMPKQMFLYKLKFMENFVKTFIYNDYSIVHGLGYEQLVSKSFVNDARKIVDILFPTISVQGVLDLDEAFNEQRAKGIYNDDPVWVNVYTDMRIYLSTKDIYRTVRMAYRNGWSLEAIQFADQNNYSIPDCEPNTIEGLTWLQKNGLKVGQPLREIITRFP